MFERNSTPLCSICTQIYIKPTVLSCGHTFCKDCLGQWLDQRRVCPHCRKKVPVRYKPIALSGWDDTLENIALQLPEEEQEERRAAKRQREEGEISKPTKRSRIENRSGQSQVLVVQHLPDEVSLLVSDLHQTMHGLNLEEAEPQSEAANEYEWEEDFLSDEEQEYQTAGDLLEDEVDEEVSDNAEEAGDIGVEVTSQGTAVTLNSSTNGYPAQYETVSAGGAPWYRHRYDLRSLAANLLSTQVLGSTFSQPTDDLHGPNELDDEDDDDDYLW